MSIRLVLDTNIVLDWLVFNGPSSLVLQRGIETGDIVILTHTPAMDELQRVLTYPILKLDMTSQADVLRRYQQQTTFATLPTGFSLQDLLLPPKFPRCRDTDDQHFLALAFHTKADALASRDKAVLKLKKRAAKFELKIFTVEEMVEWLGATRIAATTPFDSRSR